VYGTNVNPIWKEKTATITPLDLAISLPLARIYSTTCFITPQHPKRRSEYCLAIPPTFTDEDGYLVFHTIMNKDGGPPRNHAAQEEDLLVCNAPVDYDDPFPDQPSRPLDITAFQLSQHLNPKWYNSL